MEGVADLPSHLHPADRALPRLQRRQRRSCLKLSSGKLELVLGLDSIVA